LIELKYGGCKIRTQYDLKDAAGLFRDPPSLDSTMMFVVNDPAAEPRFSRCFPGGPADLQEYRMEVVDGVKDHWVDLDDKKKWQYTYHERLTKYKFPGIEEFSFINQIERMIDQLVKSPYSRRVQAVTWQPWCDMDSEDPPCLQRVWCRILEDENAVWWLQMNTDWRSRDAFKASCMNADAFIYWMGLMAEEIGRRAKREVRLGRYCDKSDSFHVYGKDLQAFEDLFMKGMHERTFEARTYRTEDLASMMQEAIPDIVEKIRKKDADEAVI
jgi:thymidylate synthase